MCPARMRSLMCTLQQNLSAKVSAVPIDGHLELYGM